MKAIITNTALKWLSKDRRVSAERYPDFLSKVRGVENWTLYVGIEHECEDDKYIYEQIDFMPVIYVNNAGPRSIDYNSITSWTKAYDDGATFFSFLENDTYPAPDFCEYTDAMNKRYKDDQTIFCINSYSGNEDLNRPNAVWRKPSLGIWGVGMWRNRAKQCLQDFKDSTQSVVLPMGWDIHLNKASRRGRDCIQPCLSRCINVGMDGFHFTGKYIPELNEINRTWSGNVDPKILNQDYIEIPRIDKSEYVRVKEWK